MKRLLGGLLLSLSTSLGWAADRLLIAPEPWGCPTPPNQGGGDIYSPEPVAQGNDTLLYFGGWVEQCRINDAIYMARIRSGKVKEITLVIAPEDHGFVALNDPAIVTLIHYATGRPYLLMYLTGVEANALPGTAGNKIYISTSWADDGLNWSTPTLLLDGYWNPGAAINPTTGDAWLWATETAGDGQWQLTAFNLGPYGVNEQSRAVVQPATHHTNPSARWLNGSWDILAQTWDAQLATNIVQRWSSSDGVAWSLVTPQLITPPPNYQAITPAWGQSNDIYYARYQTGWPPDSSIWRLR